MRIEHPYQPETQTLINMAQAAWEQPGHPGWVIHQLPIERRDPGGFGFGMTLQDLTQLMVGVASTQAQGKGPSGDLDQPSLSLAPWILPPPSMVIPEQQHPGMNVAGVPAEVAVPEAEAVGAGVQGGSQQAEGEGPAGGGAAGEEPEPSQPLAEEGGTATEEQAQDQGPLPSTRLESIKTEEAEGSEGSAQQQEQGSRQSSLKRAASTNSQGVGVSTRKRVGTPTAPPAAKGKRARGSAGASPLGLADTGTFVWNRTSHSDLLSHSTSRLPHPCLRLSCQPA